MPRIPTYQRQVNAIGSPVPVYTVKAPDMNDGWRAVDSAMSSAVQLAGTLKRDRDEKAEKARIENQKIEAAEVLAAKVELSRSLDEQSKGTIDPVTGIKKPGLMDREGKDAIGIQRDFQDHYNKELARISAGLTNPQAKIALQQFALPDKEARRQDYAAREFDQMKVFQSNQQKALDFRSGNLAADESVSDALALAALDEAKKGFLAMNQGQSKEVLDAGIASRDSNFASARLSAAPDYASKQAVFAKYENLFQGEQAVKAREMMKVFGVKDKAQGFVDQLRAAHDLTTEVGQTEAQAKIDQIKETEVRDEAQQRLDARIGHDLRRRNAADAETVNSALGEIQGDEKRGIPPKAAKDVTGYSDMRPEIKAKVDNMARDYTNGKLVELNQAKAKVQFSDPKVHDELRDLANNKVDDFLKIKDWTRYRGALTEQDVRMYQSVQDGMRQSIAKEKGAEAQALKKMQIEQAQAYSKQALDDIQKELIPGAMEGDKAKAAAVEGKRGRIADAWMRKMADQFSLTGEPPTAMQLVSWKNQLRDKIDVIDANGQTTEKGFWEMTGGDFETGVQYKSLKEYQTVNELSDNEMTQIKAKTGSDGDTLLQRLNDEAMGDYSASAPVIFPMRRQDGPREQARIMRHQELQRMKQVEEDRKADEKWHNSADEPKNGLNLTNGEIVPGL